MTSMLPTITDSARNYLIKTADKQNATNVYFGVQGGGCAGFKYKWDSIETDKINPEDEVIKLDEERKSTQTNLDHGLAEANKIAKSVGQLFKEGKQEEANLLKAKA